MKDEDSWQSAQSNTFDPNNLVQNASRAGSRQSNTHIS